jgi:DNA-binding transcriptional LysR family regulator
LPSPADMDFTLKQLQIFRAVVVAGSITKASRRLSLSQPSISQQLAKLEDKVGAQLIQRNRTGIISLTPAGEYWFKVSDEMLRRLDTANAEYRAHYVDNSVTLRMGITPTLRGRFVSKAARIAFEEPGFVKFEMRYALTSAELVEQLNLHQLNCALINVEAIDDDRSSFAVSEVFDDEIALVVPATVPVEDLRRALGRQNGEITGPLGRYVEVDASIPLRAKTEVWYRDNLPASLPMFSAMTYPAAVDICAEGLATTHCPLSLMPNLPISTLRRLQFYRVKEMSRSVALVMPRHLLTLRPYHRIYKRIEEFCRTDYLDEMMSDNLQELPVPDTTAREHGEIRYPNALPPSLDK